MEFKIQGKVSLRLFPRPRLTLSDIHLSIGKDEIVSAEELQVLPRWLPFIVHRKDAVPDATVAVPDVRVVLSGVLRPRYIPWRLSLTTATGVSHHVE